MNEEMRRVSCVLRATAALSPCWSFHPWRRAGSSSPFHHHAVDILERKEAKHSVLSNRTGSIRKQGIGRHLVQQLFG